MKLFNNVVSDKNAWINYIVGVVLALISLLYLYFSFFLVKNPAEMQKSAAEKRRDELIQSLASPPTTTLTAEERAQMIKSVSTPKAHTLTTSEREKLIKSLTEL